MAGTPLYWPPENIFEEEMNDELARLADVWSVGVVAFEAYCGIHPFYYGKYNAKYD